MKSLKAERIKIKIGDIWESPELNDLLTRENDVVVARCLDFTVSSHGMDVKDALNSLADSIKEYILTAIENDAINTIFDLAHGKYWRMFNEQETKYSYPVKSHGNKTLILPYALGDIIDKFDLPGDVFEK